MKLSKDNIKYLNNFLDEELRYRETYNEMQDHILSALERYPEGSLFETAFYQVISTQFGGSAGLRAIDRQCRKHGLVEMRKRYFKHILEMFRLPSVIYLAGVSIAAFFLFNNISTNAIANITVFVIISCLPGIINGIRYIRTGYHFHSTKRSVSDDGFRMLKYFPGVMYALFLSLLWLLHFAITDILHSINPGVATVVFISYFLHAVAFYKMYKEEFKFNWAK